MNGVVPSAVEQPGHRATIVASASCGNGPFGTSVLAVWTALPGSPAAQGRPVDNGAPAVGCYPLLVEALGRVARIAEVPVTAVEAEEIHEDGDGRLRPRRTRCSG